MNEADKKKGIEIVLKNPKKDEYTGYYLNMLCELSDLKNQEIAAYLGIKDSKLSAYKKGKVKLTTLGWSTMRHFFHEYFTNGKVTSAVYLSNKELNRS